MEARKNAAAVARSVTNRMLQQVTGGGPNDGLWYVVGANYIIDTASTINPFLKASYALAETIDPGSLNKKCQKALGGPPFAANFHLFNLKCGSGDPFAEGNFGDRVLDHEGMGSSGDNGHEAQLRLAAAEPANDPRRILERLVRPSEDALRNLVQVQLERIDSILHDASDPLHQFVKDNFVDRGGCGKAWIYEKSSDRYLEVRVYGEGGQCI